jgi:hypothetical protein
VDFRKKSDLTDLKASSTSYMQLFLGMLRTTRIEVASLGFESWYGILNF